MKKAMADLSPSDKKTFFLKNAGTSSYASLHQQDSYYKHSASLAALKSLHGDKFFDEPQSSSRRKIELKSTKHSGHELSPQVLTSLDDVVINSPLKPILTNNEQR